MKLRIARKRISVKFDLQINGSRVLYENGVNMFNGEPEKQAVYFAIYIPYPTFSEPDELFVPGDMFGDDDDELIDINGPDFNEPFFIDGAE